MLKKGAVGMVPLGAMAIALVVLFSQTGWSEETKDAPGDPRKGQKLFLEKKCMRCHSIWESTQKMGPSLASVGMGRNLYELCASIWSHWSRMNAAREQEEKEAPTILTSSEFRDIIAYLYYINYYKEPGDPSEGKATFVSRGCSRCHATDPLSAEGKEGPSVYEMKDFEGPINLAVALWNHGTGMLRQMSQKQISWPLLQDKNVADLVSYLRQSSAPLETGKMPAPGDPLRGHELFKTRSCGGCHEPISGRPGIGPNLQSSGAAASLSSLVASLWNHYPKMVQAMSSKGIPAVQMTTDDMEDLMAYVYWIRAYGLTGKPSVGRDLYQSKQCASCHTRTSEQAASAPLLVGSESTKSPYAMLAAIWNHGPKMESLLQQRKIAWPSLTGEDMRNLIAFFQAPATQSRQ